MRLPLLFLALAATSALVRAAPVPIANPGFEADPVPAGAFIVGVPSGWSLYDPSGVVDQIDNAVGLIRPLPGVEYFPAGTPEGNQAALVYLAGLSAVPVGLQQTLGAVLQPHTTYTLRVDVGNIASGTSLPGSSDGGGQFYDLSGFSGYRLELLAGDTLLAFDDNSLGLLIPEGQFREAQLTFDSGAAPIGLGQALTIRLINLDLAPGSELTGIETDFDNVRLSADSQLTVPEPGSAALLLLGLAGLAGLTGSARRPARRGVQP